MVHYSLKYANTSIRSIIWGYVIVREDTITTMKYLHIIYTLLNMNSKKISINMTLDIVTKGIPFLHMAIVTAMVFAGVPRIISYTAMLWGVCAIMSIPLTEEEFYLEFPSLWRYRHLFGLGICFMISQSV